MEDEKYPDPEPPQPQMLGQAAEEMPMYNQTLAKAQAEALGISAMPHRPTVTEILQHKRAAVAKELEYIDKALAEAKANEGAMNLIDAIAKTQVTRNY